MGEVQAMGDFFTMLSNQPDRAQYGFNHVKVCLMLFLWSKNVVMDLLPHSSHDASSTNPIKIFAVRRGARRG